MRIEGREEEKKCKNKKKVRMERKDKKKIYGEKKQIGGNMGNTDSGVR